MSTLKSIATSVCSPSWPPSIASDASKTNDHRKRRSSNLIRMTLSVFSYIQALKPTKHCYMDEVLPNIVVIKRFGNKNIRLDSVSVLGILPV